MTVTPAIPIAPFVPKEPDADWETVRARVMSELAAAVPDSWSDHNAADPGVTLAEVAAFGLADLHYRAEERPLDAWPLEVRDWLSDADRHWHATLPVGSLTTLAGALASSDGASAVDLEPPIRACASREDALALLSQAPWGSAFSAEQRPAVIELMRGRLVRQIAHEHADVIAQAVAAQGDDSTIPLEDRDAAAVAELALSLPLWPVELTALVRRERRRLSCEALVARLAEVRAVTDATAADLRRSLTKKNGLDPTETGIAIAAAPMPPGMLPEDLEHPAGHSRVWPPHPIQALTCEPVTADDYARRARAHPGVGRAWAVPGRLEGIAWNGLPTGTTAAIVADENARAVTLVVERVKGSANPGGFLRSVLTTAIGSEAMSPFPDWRADVDELEPRRMICDEVGASLLEIAPILVQATLVTDVGVDRDEVIRDVRGRISAFFAARRPESRLPDPVPTVDGPWPRNDQPQGGWIPGDPIRFTEIVEAMAGNPEVWGVETVAMKVEGDPLFVTPADGSLQIPPNAIPVLADARCIRVRFALTTGCGDA